jgi:hypothetical protein
MTRAEIEARAAQRAYDQHVHIFSVPGRPGVYTTKSKSQPGERYTLVARDGIEACSCKGYEYRQSCKHVEALRNRLAREAVKAIPAVRAATARANALLYAD